MNREPWLIFMQLTCAMYVSRTPGGAGSSVPRSEYGTAQPLGRTAEWETSPIRGCDIRHVDTRILFSRLDGVTTRAKETEYSRAWGPLVVPSGASSRRRGGHQFPTRFFHGLMRADSRMMWLPISTQT